MRLFNGYDHYQLSLLFRREHRYAGYKPDVLEAPNGDGKVDAEKRYLHVALKYAPPEWAVEYLARAHFAACQIAEALNVPDVFYPRVQDGTLRVIEYPVGAGSAEHTDFDLFTVHCYRSTPADFVRLDDVDPRAEAVDPDVHLGEIAEAIGVGTATRHRVPARSYTQSAIVYFAMPSLVAKLPSGETVLEWLQERKTGRSRVYK